MTHHSASPAAREEPRPGAAGGGEWRDVRASAATAGGRCALELELYRRTGVLAMQASSAGARRFLSAASLAHAWRADLWERLLPVSIGLPAREELVVLAAEDAGLLGSLEGAAGGSVTAAAGVPVPLLEGVYPSMLAGYEQLAETASRVSDGPLALAATRSAGDVRRVLAEGLALRLAAVAGEARGAVRGAASGNAAGERPAAVRGGPGEPVAGRSLNDGLAGQDGDQNP